MILEGELRERDAGLSKTEGALGFLGGHVGGSDELLGDAGNALGSVKSLRKGS